MISISVLLARPTRDTKKPVFKMPDGHDADKTGDLDEAATVKEATVGVKADVKTLQQLSSSGIASRKKREENHAQKGFKAVGEAVERYFGSGGEEGGKQDSAGQ
ncbi:hypothetical protein FQN50_004579 [Emmonsiellopsis sp. PD_5]|nr:hypothetical protein FQN50_004579 [Emmonsiellopsis sp. PD_5]